MKKVMMVLAVAACVLAVSACKNGSKAAEGETECTECCCDETKCAECDSCACNVADSVAVVETVAEEVKAE